jgi:hypothetical protein
MFPVPISLAHSCCSCSGIILSSVAEPHHYYAAPAPGKNFDVAPAPSLLYSRPTFLKSKKVNIRVGIFSNGLICLKSL